jgi:hypothetical protein
MSERTNGSEPAQVAKEQVPHAPRANNGAGEPLTALEPSAAESIPWSAILSALGVAVVAAIAWWVASKSSATPEPIAGVRGGIVGPLGAAFAAMTVALGLAALWQRGTFQVAFALAATVCASSFLFGLASALGIWGFVLGALPAAMVIRHAVYVRLLRKDELEESPNNPMRAGQPRLSETAKRRHERNYSVGLLTIRFGIPAYLIVVASSFVYAALLAQSPLIDTKEDWIEAAQLGAFGAYVYVLITLGERAVRRDITAGIAQWSVVMLVLGPTIAAVAQKVTGQKANDSFGAQAFYFVAGLSPRWVASVIEEGVRRLWSGRASEGDGVSTPLIRIRGITRAVAERLEEEGIFDVHSLAMADPLKLLRSTNFDLRQIVDWMDAALLIHLAPHLAAKLFQQGFVGAIQLAHLRDQDLEITPRRIEEVSARAAPQLSPDQLGRLKKAAAERDPAARLQQTREVIDTLDPAAKEKILAELDPGRIIKLLASKLETDELLLQNLVNQLFLDEQVRLVWVLYNLHGDALDGE